MVITPAVVIVVGIVIVGEKIVDVWVTVVVADVVSENHDIDTTVLLVCMVMLSQEDETYVAVTDVVVEVVSTLTDVNV